MRFFDLTRAMLALLLSLTVISSLLASCGSEVKANESFGTDSTERSGADGAVEFTDALGRTVTVHGTPTRVAALIGSFADVWTLSGGTLCAAPEDAWEDFGLSLDGAVNIGGAHSVSLELLLSADPELVLASASTASNIEMRDALEAMGITVAYFDVDCFEDYLAMLRICTDITGREDLYIQNGLEIDRKINDIKARYAQSNIPEEQRRVLLLRASSSSVKAKGSKGTVLGEMLLDIGCVNIADSDRTLLESLGTESVIKEEPYHIFVVTMGSDTEAARASLERMLNGDPAWSTLGAIMEGRLHVMDKTLFNLKPNERWGEAYEVLYEALTDS